MTERRLDIRDDAYPLAIQLVGSAALVRREMADLPAAELIDLVLSDAARGLKHLAGCLRSPDQSARFAAAAAIIDERQAKIFLFDRDEAKAAKLSTELPHHQTHNKAGTIDGKRSQPDDDFYREIIESLGDSREWLVLGPATAKHEFVEHVRNHHPKLSERIIGVEVADHPTDGQILAQARAYFRAADRMLP